MPVQLIRHLLTVSDYHLMQEVGILSEEDHVELLNGDHYTTHFVIKDKEETNCEVLELKINIDKIFG